MKYLKPPSSYLESNSINKKRYFIDKDQSGHRFLVDAKFKKEWDQWNNLPEDDENSWVAPGYAMVLDGSFVTFSDPEVNGRPI